MARVRHPNLQNARGHYLEGATVTAITNRDTEAPATAYTTEDGGTTITYPVVSGPEGDVDIWVAVGSYETTFGDDSVDTPAVWEAISGEELANMLTVDDLPGLSTLTTTVSPVDFGADPTGVADCSVAFIDAIIWCKFNGAVLDLGAPQLPEGLDLDSFGPGVNPASVPVPVYAFDNPITNTETNRRPFRMTASNPGKAAADLRGGTMLYRGEPGFPPLLLLEACSKFQIDNIAFEYNDDNGAFDGDLVYINGTSNGDCQDWAIRRCSFSNHDGVARTARSMLSVRKSIIAEIGPRNHFTGGAYGIRYADDSYCVGIDQHHNTFNTNDSAHVLVGPSVFQKNSIHHEVFEVNQAVEGALPANGFAVTNGCWNFTYHDNWHGDRTAGANAPWVSNLASERGPCTIENNFFYTRGTPGGFIDGLRGDVWRIVGNTLVGSGGGADSVFGDASAVDVIQTRDNTALNVEHLWDVPPLAYDGQGNDFPLSSSGADDGAQDNLLRGAQIATGTAAPGVLPMDPAKALNARVVMGASESVLVCPGNMVLVYYQDDNLILQTEDGATKEIKLMAGSNPNAGIRLGATGTAPKVAFFSTAPVTKETGVAVDTAAIHAALVRLGLIAA